jgi:predicted amidohydrolase YtcJ
MRRMLLLLPILSIALLSCNSQKMKADLIVTNALVYTVNDSFATAESFAVKDGKFVAVGTNAEISSGFSAGQTIDCHGKPVYPGFNDAHCHFFGYGMDLMQYADLAGSQNPEVVYGIIQDHYAKSGGKWLLGRGWDQNLWPGKAFPDNKRLNELFPDVPVYLIRIDGHAAWCNEKALKLAGITATTKVNGGEVLVKNGQPTGVLIDNAKEIVFDIIPEPDKELKIKALLIAQKNCQAVGLTSVTDCGLPKKTILLIDSLQQQGLLKMRINAMMDPSKANMEYFLEKGPYKTALLQVNTIKLYADGALGSRGAYLVDDYSDDPGNRGLLMSKEAYFDSVCQRAYDAKFQIATHCIGDGANRFILNIYSKFLKGKNDRRWRIEHAQVVQKEDLKLFAEYAVVPSIQATHATSDMFWAGSRLGTERLKTAYAYKQLLEQNGWLPNGTDFPIESINPILTFYASVFRKNPAGLPAEGFQMENALTREQTLRSMTTWAAKASFEEQSKGSIEAGKSADFVVLDTDIMSCPENDILQSKVLQTVLNGEVVYKKE